MLRSRFQSAVKINYPCLPQISEANPAAVVICYTMGRAPANFISFHQPISSRAEQRPMHRWKFTGQLIVLTRLNTCCSWESCKSEAKLPLWLVISVVKRSPSLHMFRHPGLDCKITMRMKACRNIMAPFLAPPSLPTTSCTSVDLTFHPKFFQGRFNQMVPVPGY